MLAYVLLRISRLWGDDELERRAVGVFRFVAPALSRAPSAFGHALNALDLYFASPRELAIVGTPDAPVARAALAAFEPNAVVAFGPSERAAASWQRPRRRPPGCYVCERFACQAPTTNPADFKGAQPRL